MMNRRVAQYRSQSRRSARELAAAAREVQADTTEMVARAEILRRLADHVLTLPGPNRDVILMRHFNAMQPREIAVRLGVSVDTVNNRLKRGHELLRERLAREDGPEWPIALLPLLRWPVQVPFDAPAPAPARRPMLKAAGLVAAGVAVLVTGSFWLVNGQGAAPAPGLDTAAAPHSTTPPTGGGTTAHRAHPRPADAGAPSPDDSAKPIPVASAVSPPGDPEERKSVTAVGRIEADGGAVPTASSSRSRRCLPPSGCCPALRTT